MQQALAAQKKALKSGLAFDGPAFSQHLKAKVRGEKTQRPAPISLSSIKTVKA
jgi:hypothetical protein